MRNITFDGWFWIYTDGRIYSSAAADYVPADDPALLAWKSDGTEPTPFDSEYELGVTLYVHLLRPIPQAILDGYLDAQMDHLERQPDYQLWLDTYVPPASTQAEGRAILRAMLQKAK